ncbi:biogenesis of lysosome-related organelles complex 1 subunit 4-like [Cimex lectularius]|uniref:Biogenesis of lysosome-related organelles complex 1 subunit 4 n=1 Tax=Cimex lectularius TaxID=79782 RepID=A0A8I6RLU7_CIMLE|nr:biogenesis of lysosome-related organelles complex 1 subunit 4-like [Cimex lectularius]
MDSDAQELADTWANFIRVDMSQGIKNVENSIEDTLTRLDEFTGVIDLLRRESNFEAAYTILAKKPELMLLFERIRKLERIIDTVKQTVNSFEHIVTTAESELNFTPEGKLLNYIKPLFFKKQSASLTRSGALPTFISPEIFSTKDLFAE